VRLFLILAILALAVTTAFPRGLGAQDVGARLDARVAPAVRSAVQDIAADAAARGLPTEPLVEKAIEGGAKRVPSERLIAAVRALAARLGEAADAVRAGGIASPAAEVVEGGADGLSAGLSAAQVTDLVRASHQGYEPALVLRVAATLAALGVPASQTVQLVEGMMSAGRTPGDLLGLPGDVQAGVASGSTPAQAAAGLARAAGGTPPGRTPGWVPPGQTNPHRPPPNPHKP
jgi:hypothetical protein